LGIKPYLTKFEANKLTPSIEPFPSIELKALPNHLKYVYLGEQETLPVITVSHLTVGHEKTLCQFLGNIRKPLVGP